MVLTNHGNFPPLGVAADASSFECQQQQQQRMYLYVRQQQQEQEQYQRQQQNLVNLQECHRYPTIYNDLNLFENPANVNVVKPQPMAVFGLAQPVPPLSNGNYKDTDSATPPPVSHISSNGYYGFVQIHAADDSTMEPSNRRRHQNNDSMDSMDIVENGRKRSFVDEETSVTMKKGRFDSEGKEIATLRCAHFFH